MYYNTTKESGHTLGEYQRKAESQKDYLLKVINLASRNNKCFTTSTSLLMCLPAFSNSPATSIRRAITNLVDEGKLVYTGEKRMGMYGRKESIIKLNK